VKCTSGQAIFFFYHWASVRGKVLDASGTIARNAYITAVQVDTDFCRTAPSDSLGNFILVELPVGSYRPEAEANDFREFEQEGITLHVNPTASLTVQLAVGTTTQIVEVNANASMIEPTTTNLGTTVGDREVLDLSLNGRPKTLSRCNDVVEGEKKPGAWEGKSPHRVLNMPSNYS
jgi:hypothetical protein